MRWPVFGEARGSKAGDLVAYTSGGTGEEGELSSNADTRFTAVVEGTRDCISIKDRSLTYRFVNRSFSDLVDLAAADVIGKTDEDLFGEEGSGPIRQSDERVLAGETVEDELQISLFGVPCLFHMRKVPLFDGEGGITGICTVARDVTSSMIMEEGLRHAEEKYRSIFRNAAEGIFQATAEGRFLTANPALAIMLGYRTAEELMVKVASIADQVYVDPNRWTEFTTILESRDWLLDYEIEYKRRDGSRFWVSTNVRVVRDAVGRLLYYEGASTDITERKRAEEGLKQAFGRLKLVLEGTVLALSRMAELRDPYTVGHQRRVAQLAKRIAEKMKLPAETVECVYISGILHDIGKANVPAEILVKPVPLNEYEINILRSHPKFGFEILNGIEFSYPVATTVLHHHERMNGSGYPLGLVAHEIAIEARILAVADVVEAVSTHRPYRPAVGMPAAIAEIESNSGILYDPPVVDACLHLFRDDGFVFE